MSLNEPELHTHTHTYTPSLTLLTPPKIKEGYGDVYPIVQNCLVGRLKGENYLNLELRS